MSLPTETSILIIGAGPVGLTLANLLGSEGVATVLVERNPGCVPEPRAVALDGESLRTLQSAGLADTVIANTRQGFVADYINGDGVHLFATDLTARPYGFCLQNTFDQPLLERQLLAGLARFPCVTVRHNTELVSFTQDSDGVSAVLRGGGEERTLHAGFMVGCDGGRSSVRQGLGIAMVGERLPQKWLVIDTVDTHLGEEPACRFYCDPRRPAMTIIRPGAERRWEWMLMGDERSEDMLEEECIRELLAGHTDPNKVDVYRKCVYSFSAVVAERFSDGRVFLAGDAAHMTPPFAGQGLNAGIRDVRNLSWKLARVVAGTLPPALLYTYDLERREAAQAMVDMAVGLGDQIQPTDPAAAAARDAMFAELNADPTAAMGFGAEVVAPLSDIRLPRGWFVVDGTGGRMLPQPLVASSAGEVLLDDLLGPGFTALVHGNPVLPAELTSHPLWQALAPTLYDPGDGGNSRSLASFVGTDKAGITLVRPDRFVLAELPLDAGATGALDRLATLQAMLARPVA
jgi:3-(3-hydroxy-phenyl)propionate hydroxylase